MKKTEIPWLRVFYGPTPVVEEACRIVLRVD